MISPATVVPAGKVLALPGELDGCHNVADSPHIQSGLDSPQCEWVLRRANYVFLHNTRYCRKVPIDTPGVAPFVDHSL